MKSIPELIAANEALIKYTSNRVTLSALTDWFLSFFINDLDLNEHTMDVVNAELAQFYVSGEIEKLEIKELIARYVKAYERANAKTVKVQYHNGFFRIDDGVKNWMRAKICRALVILEARPKKTK